MVKTAIERGVSGRDRLVVAMVSVILVLGCSASSNDNPPGTGGASGSGGAGGSGGSFGSGGAPATGGAGGDAGGVAGADGGSGARDGSTGAVSWQDPPAVEPMTRTAARTYCAGLVLNGNDDWRLPSISELRTLVAGCPATQTGGACTLVDQNGRASGPPYGSCTGCAIGAGPGAAGCYWTALAGTCGRYWSTTNLFDSMSEGHALDFANASIMTLGWFDSQMFRVRCVRTPP